MRRVGLIYGDDVQAVGMPSPQQNKKKTVKAEVTEKDKKRKSRQEHEYVSDI